MGLLHLVHELNRGRKFNKRINEGIARAFAPDESENLAGSSTQSAKSERSAPRSGIEWDSTDVENQATSLSQSTPAPVWKEGAKTHANGYKVRFYNDIILAVARKTKLLKDSHHNRKIARAERRRQKVYDRYFIAYPKSSGDSDSYTAEYYIESDCDDSASINSTGTIFHHRNLYRLGQTSVLGATSTNELYLQEPDFREDEARSISSCDTDTFYSCYGSPMTSPNISSTELSIRSSNATSIESNRKLSTGSTTSPNKSSDEQIPALKSTRVLTPIHYDNLRREYPAQRTISEHDAKVCFLQDDEYSIFMPRVRPMKKTLKQK